MNIALKVRQPKCLVLWPYLKMIEIKFENDITMNNNGKNSLHNKV